MNDKQDALDKWLQKTVAHNSDVSPNQKKGPNTDEPKKERGNKRKKHISEGDKQKPRHDKKRGKRPNKQANAHAKPKAKPHGKSKPHAKKGNHKPRPPKKEVIKANPLFQAPKGAKKLRIIPLGGLNQVGQNMMAFEYDKDIVVIDMGLQFPEDDMLGVDYIVPDTDYLQANKDKIRGILITHGHLDHIGAIPYLSPKLGNPKFYGTPLTIGLIEKHLQEWKLKDQSNLITVKPLESYKIGVFKVTFFRVNHSIPDSTGIMIETPEGIIVHSGDFKFDFTPADGVMADTEFLTNLGKKNVLALFSDSTNATKPGHTMSEKVVGETLDQIIRETDGRLIIASFSSLIGRMQQIIDSAKRNNRKIYITGRSMITNVKIAKTMGYLKYPDGLVRDLKKAKKEADAPNAVIITTGSQGEPLAALTRMAMNSHPTVKINPKDTVIFSSSPIIGNERAVTAVVNELSRRGARVINNKAMDVHTTGHGQQEDLKMMINMVKPKYFSPVHGEFYMRKAHIELAMECGIPKENTILADNGSIITAEKGKVSLGKQGIEQGLILVDSGDNSLSDIGSHILSEREYMASNGIITINLVIDKQKKLKEVNVRSHGFIYMKETAKILKECESKTRSLYKGYVSKQKGKLDVKDLRYYLQNQIRRQVSNRIERTPLVSAFIIGV